MAWDIAWRRCSKTARARPAQVRAECHRRVLRADQSRLPGGRDRLPPRAQRARSRADAGLARGQVARPCAERHKPPVLVLGAISPGLREAASRPAQLRTGAPETPASILYTSGTTGRPKGCILSHGYVVSCGARYASLGGAATLRQGQERIYNPLPLYHANAGVVSLMGAILHGQLPDPARSLPSPALVARDRRTARATIVHYLGIIAPLLLAQPAR